MSALSKELVLILLHRHQQNELDAKFIRCDDFASSWDTIGTSFSISTSHCLAAVRLSSTTWPILYRSCVATAHLALMGSWGQRSLLSLLVPPSSQLLIIEPAFNLQACLPFSSGSKFDFTFHPGLIPQTCGKMLPDKWRQARQYGADKIYFQEKVEFQISWRWPQKEHRCLPPFPSVRFIITSAHKIPAPCAVST